MNALKMFAKPIGNGSNKEKNKDSTTMETTMTTTITMMTTIMMTTIMMTTIMMTTIMMTTITISMITIIMKNIPSQTSGWMRLHGHGLTGTMAVSFQIMWIFTLLSLNGMHGFIILIIMIRPNAMMLTPGNIGIALSRYTNNMLSILLTKLLLEDSLGTGWKRIIGIGMSSGISTKFRIT
jgi:uncharacterized membrane protein YhaH (DUF805 family)